MSTHPSSAFLKILNYKTMTQDVYTDYEIKEFAAITPLSDTDGFMHDWVFHFNPYNKTHGAPGMKERHVGDLGNIETNSKGEAQYVFYDDVIKLRGTKANIIGRGLIIHADEDDCGVGGDAESLKTGNAGKRIACAVIGYSKENF
jgi:hypothetical protein